MSSVACEGMVPAVLIGKSEIRSNSSCAKRLLVHGFIVALSQKTTFYQSASGAPSAGAARFLFSSVDGRLLLLCPQNDFVKVRDRFGIEDFFVVCFGPIYFRAGTIQFSHSGIASTASDALWSICISSIL